MQGAEPASIPIVFQSEEGFPKKGPCRCGSSFMRAAMKYYDEKCYQFHEKDLSDRCFTCGQGAARLLIVRQIAGMMLVHLCPNCMVDHMDDYLLDNTRPWVGEK